jgi:hypothetical protein
MREAAEHTEKRAHGKEGSAAGAATAVFPRKGLE